MIFASFFLLSLLTRLVYGETFSYLGCPIGGKRRHTVKLVSQPELLVLVLAKGVVRQYLHSLYTRVLCDMLAQAVEPLVVIG